MSKCCLRVSACCNGPLSFGLIQTIGYDLDYSITDTVSVVDHHMERGATIDFHSIEKDELYQVWLRIFVYLKSISTIIERHCAFLSWKANDYHGCIWEFFESVCPSKEKRINKMGIHV